MGCDIHLFFERKVDGAWQEIEVDPRLVPDDRNYCLFSFLAGVRNYGQFKSDPQFEQRGIPSDSSMPDMRTDLHSFTYAYLDEILRAPWKEVGLEDCYFLSFCEDILPRLACSYGTLSDCEQRDIRVIMGFDN